MSIMKIVPTKEKAIASLTKDEQTKLIAQQKQKIFENNVKIFHDLALWGPIADFKKAKPDYHHGQKIQIYSKSSTGFQSVRGKPVELNDELTKQYSGALVSALENFLAHTKRPDTQYVLGFVDVYLQSQDTPKPLFAVFHIKEFVNEGVWTEIPKGIFERIRDYDGKPLQKDTILIASASEKADRAAASACKVLSAIGFEEVHVSFHDPASTDRLPIDAFDKLATLVAAKGNALEEKKELIGRQAEEIGKLVKEKEQLQADANSAWDSARNSNTKYAILQKALETAQIKLERVHFGARKKTIKQALKVFETAKDEIEKTSPKSDQ